MRSIPIQGLDKTCSQLILGTSSFTPEKPEVFEMLDAYAERGGNTLDTAFIYGHGKSERTIGRWLKLRKNRDEMIIIGKGGHHDVDREGRHDVGRKRVDPESITQDLRKSLERLEVDYIDIYLLHRDDPSVPVADLVEILQAHIRQGLIKVAGVSNWSYQRIEEANQYAERKGYSRFVVNSPSLSLAKVNVPRWSGTVYVDRDYADWHKGTQMPLLSWASQASGFFSGRFTPEMSPDPDIARVYYNEENWERLRRAGKLAKIKGDFSAQQIALSFVLHQPFPIGAVIGPQNIEELFSCFKATEISLTEEERLWLDPQ